MCVKINKKTIVGVFMLLKNKTIFTGIYFSICVICSAFMIFEMPSVVFYAPILLFAVFVVEKVITNTQMNFDISAFLLFVFIFAFTYFTYTENSGLYYQAYIYIHAFMYYVMGINFIKDVPNEEKKKYIELSLIIVSIFYIVYVILTMLNYYFLTDADLKVRYFYSFWYPEVVKACTAFSVVLSIPVVYGIYALFFSSVPKKILGLIFVSVSLGVNIYTGTRTMLYLTPAVFVAVLFLWLIFVKKKYIVAVASFAAVGLLGILLYFLFVKNKENILTVLADKPIYRLFAHSVFDSRRFDYAFNVINNFSFTYTGGSYFASTFGQAHNVWLNFYDAGGIVPFIVFVLFTVSCAATFIKFIFNRYIDLSVKFLFSMIIGMIIVQFSIEPLVLPVPSYFILSMFYLGSVNSFNYNTETSKFIQIVRSYKSGS